MGKQSHERRLIRRAQARAEKKAAEEKAAAEAQAIGVPTVPDVPPVVGPVPPEEKVPLLDYYSQTEE